MSPELFNYKSYSFKSDIWSLGCVFYEMCSQKHAFSAQTINALALKIIKGKFSALPLRFNKEIKELIRRMLTVNEAERPNSTELLKLPIIRKSIANYTTKLFNRKSKISTPQLEVIIKQLSVAGAISHLYPNLLPNDIRSYLKERFNIFKENDQNYKNSNVINGLREVQSNEELIEHYDKSKRKESSIISKIQFNVSSCSQPSEFGNSEFNEEVPNDDDFDDFEFMDEIDENSDISVNTKGTRLINSSNNSSRQSNKLILASSKLHSKNFSQLAESKSRCYDDSFNDSSDLRNISDYQNDHLMFNLEEFSFNSLLGQKIEQSYQLSE